VVFGKSIIFIGPYGIGKTCTAKGLATLLEWPFFDLDDELNDIVNRLDEIDSDRFFHSVSELIPDLVEIQRPYYPRIIYEFLASKPKAAVFAFGFTQTVFMEKETIEEVAELLKSFEVILLLPAFDPSSRERVLLEQLRNSRRGKSILLRESDEKILKKIRYGLHCKSNVTFATSTFFVNGKTASQVSEEIYSKLVK